MKKAIDMIWEILVFLLLIGIGLGAVILAVLTAIPDSSASKDCLLGYKAHCSFTPISTVLLIMVALSFLFLAFRKYHDMAARSPPRLG